MLRGGTTRCHGDTKMNAILSYVSAGVLAVCALLVSPQTVQAATATRLSDQATVAAMVHKGDQVIVTTNAAPLMIGAKVLAKLSGGQKLRVTAIQDAWLGTSLTVKGKTVSGWVESTNVMLVRQGDGKKAVLAASPVIQSQPDASERSRAAAIGGRPVGFTSSRPVSPNHRPAGARLCPGVGRVAGRLRLLLERSLRAGPRYPPVGTLAAWLLRAYPRTGNRVNAYEFM